MKVFLRFILLLVVSGIIAAQTPAPADPELDKVKERARQAWAEADEFTKGGKKGSDAEYPGRKWAAQFWQYREQHPGTPATHQATFEALHLLVHAEQFSEFMTKVDSLKPDDGAWKRVFSALSEAAHHQKNYEYLIKKATFLLVQAPDKDVKMQAQYTLADALRQKGDGEQAKAAFQKLIREYPNSRFVKAAENALYEIEALNVGQAAPSFAFKSSAGERVALTDFKGKVTLLFFWASW